MEDYILRGGVYGNNENRISVQQQKKGGQIRYALTKIFLPYSEIKFHYPILQKHKWLTLFMEVRRWFKLIFCGHAKRTLNELKFNQTIKYVDRVVPQTTLDKMLAYREYKFNALFHGSDWKDSNMYKKITEEMSQVGVDVIFLPHTDGISSTILAEVIKKHLD